MQIRPGYYEIQNAGKLRNHGYELDAAYKYEGLTLRAGVAYSKPELDGRTVDSTVTAIPIGRTWTTGVSYRFEQPDVEIGWKGRCCTTYQLRFHHQTSRLWRERFLCDLETCSKR